MASYTLTQHAVSDMYNEQTVESPILQITNVKKAKPQTTTERYRVVISDGSHFLQGMLSTQLNGLVSSGKVDRNTVIRLRGYHVQTVQSHKVVICLQLDALETLSERIGEPTAVEQSNTNNTSDAGGDVKPAVAGVTNSTSNNNSSMSYNNNAAAYANTAKPAAPSQSRPVFPIEGLSPYANKWTIKARVTQKSDIRHYSSARGEGKLFNVNFLDDSGEIRATGFNEAADRFFNILNEGDVYYVSKARVNLANKKFSNLNNEYEIMFDSNTEIEKCTDSENLPQIKYDFVEVGKLENVDKDATCDVIGVVKDVGDIQQITSKTTQKPINKRELTVVDKTNYAVRMTLWNKQAENFSPPPQPIIAFRNVKVGDFGGRSLSMLSSSTMMIDPDIPEAHALRGWYDSQGSGQDFQNFSAGNIGGGAAFREQEARSLAQVKEDRLGEGEQTDYFNTRAMILYIKSDTFSYPACPSESCNKKVVMEGDNSWRCEKCDKSYAEPEYRYIMSISVGDYSSQIWVSAFNEVGQMILGGRSAGEMEKLRNEDEDEFKAVVHEAQCRIYDFVCRAKADTFNDSVKIRYQVQTAKPIDWTDACKQLVKKFET